MTYEQYKYLQLFRFFLQKRFELLYNEKIRIGYIIEENGIVEVMKHNENNFKEMELLESIIDIIDQMLSDKPVHFVSYCFDVFNLKCFEPLIVSITACNEFESDLMEKVYFE